MLQTPVFRASYPKLVCKHALQLGPGRSASSPRRCISNLPKPRIAERSLWESIVPRALRDRQSRSTEKQDDRATSKPISNANEWNPATFFIVIFLIIGSNAINLIAVRTGAENFSRRAATRISVLREAIELVHKGETVDVAKLLGSEEEAQEREWEEAMKEFEAAVRSRIPQGEEHRVRNGKVKEEADMVGDTPISDAPDTNNGTARKPDATDSQPQPRFY